MSDYELETRTRIIDSVIKKRNTSGEGPTEEYVAHLKIWETENGQDKMRLADAAVGGGYPVLHKTRVNPNGTFSVGKTWKLADLRAIEINAVQQPLEVLITFARTYVWQTDSLKDQERFLSTLVTLFFESFGPNAPLQIAGFNPSQPSRIQSRSDLRSVKSTATIKESRSLAQLNGSSAPRSRSRPPQANGRAASPAESALSGRAASPMRAGVRPISSRPSSPALSTISTPYSRRQRRPSNATNSSATSYDSAGRIPSIVAPQPSVSPSPSVPNRIKEPSPLRPRPSRPDGLSQNGAPGRSSLDIPSVPSSFSSATASSSLLSVATSIGGSTVTANTEFSPVSAYAPDLPSETGSRQRGPSRVPSPTPSSTSRKSQHSRRGASSPEPYEALPPAPRINRLPSSGQPSRKDANTRISFFDPLNQAALDRLLFASAVRPAAQTASPDTNADGVALGEGDDIEWEEGDTVAATLTNIEEMLEGYEWIGDGLSSQASKGTGEQIESRLLDELVLLDRANIHSLLESDDDRIAKVLKGLEDAISELNSMDKTISSYKIHLNAVSDDISFIQSQNRGLQVQTQNQQLLLSELEKLLQTVHVSRESLMTLTQESLEKDDGIANLEMAVTELYKALLAGRDNDMAATMERLEEYRTYNSQFCKRILDFLTIMFTAQSNILLGDNNGLATSGEKGRPVLLDHQRMETYLGRYCGLMLYLKEMDEARYSKICAAYFSAASELHSKQIKALLNSYNKLVRYATEEELEQAFISPNAKDSLVSGGLRRAGTVVRGPDGKKDKGRKSGSGLRSFEVLDIVLEQLAPQVARERGFIADFLLINDASITFADYLSLDHYFRRQATQCAGLSSATMKLVRNAMDLIFGFLPAELKGFVDAALAKDNIQVVGAIASVERGMADADMHGNSFFTSVLEKQHLRLKMLLDRHVDEQIKCVEQTRLDTKKRSGVAHFIRYFPTYVSRIESQLVGADGLEIRSGVDVAYDRIVQAMFASLKQMAKIDGELGEDKGQLNYHVILIENMHHFIGDTRQLKINASGAFKRQAETTYNENLSAYVRLILRRPFAKIIDYFEGVERMLKTTAPTEVSKNSSYSRSMLKRVVKEFNAKDVRKNIDALFKRVEKHFTDADASDVSSNTNSTAVMAGVWKACEEEMLRMTDSFQSIIGQCYKESGVGLEYSRSDVDAAFKRHRLATS